MANIYAANGNTLTEGLQGSAICDEAIQVARQSALNMGEPVILEDADEWSVVTPGGEWFEAKDPAHADRIIANYEFLRLAKRKSLLKTLDQLRDALASDDRTVGLPENHGEIDWSDLPTFGGEEPDDTNRVWSWDKKRLLVGTGARDLRIISREEAA